MSQLNTVGTDKGKKRSEFGSFLLRVVMVFSFLVLALGACCYVYVNGFLGRAGSLPPREIEVVIPPDSSFSAISRDLEKQGVVSDARLFSLYAQWKGQTARLRVGRFLVNTGWLPGQVLDHLINGAPVLEKILIPEGLTWWQTGRRLEQAGLVNFDDFSLVVHDPEFLRHWGIPFDTAEGYLFPDTYFIMRPLTLDKKSAAGVAGRLLDNFWRRIAMLYEGGAKLDQTERRHLGQRITLASIVEKETALAVERARVAGVYTNRMDRSMLLQADPTVIYGIGPSFGGNLGKADLLDAGNAYNTYRHSGLPPGPICSPGLAAIRAAIHPETHSYLYFVAKGDGSHQFSVNLSEHNRAVRAYVLDREKNGRSRP